MDDAIFIFMEPINIVINFRMRLSVHAGLNSDNAFRFFKFLYAPAIRVTQSIFIQ